MRILGIKAPFIGGLLDRLIGVIAEYEVIDRENGIFVWRGRHPVISNIILKYKYGNQESLFEIFRLVADNSNPSYHIERVTINEMCDHETRIGRLHDKAKQNYLFRRLISLAPSLPVPRHRLINNLIDMGDYEGAANEIRLFEKELRQDAPVMRYKAMLLVGRATSVPGLMTGDKLVMLNDAISLVEAGLKRYPSDKPLHRLNSNIGLEIFKLNGQWDAFDNAMARLADAEKDCLDPEMSRMMTRIKARAESFARAGIIETF